MKNVLRKTALEKRKKLNKEECSKKIMQKLFALNVYKKAKNIICYYPLKCEISDIDCINDKTKNIFLPRVNDINLEICPYLKDKITAGAFGIKEPTTNAINDYSFIDLIIIPCVTADRNGYRIGYGKGYYDRLLPHFSKNTTKIIITYSDLLLDNIYPDNYDIPADIVITEKEVLIINKDYNLSKKTIP